MSTQTTVKAGDTLEIPAGTTIIHSREYANGEFKTLILPDTLERIEKQAFIECKNLTCVFLPASLTYIGEGAFKDCTSLREAYIPKSVVSIGEEAFTHFKLIYCEAEERPAGWCMEFEEDVDGADIEDEEKRGWAIIHREYRTWCGNFEYTFTFNEIYVKHKDYKINPEIRVVWDTNARYLRKNGGNALNFDIFSYLRGMRNKVLKIYNAFMRNLLNEMKTCTESDSFRDANLLILIEVYNDTVLDVTIRKGHEEEWLFYSWALYNYVWQLSQSDVRKERMMNWPNVVKPIIEQYSELLVNERKEWKKLLRACRCEFKMMV